MLIQGDEEKRVDYLMRVLKAYVAQHIHESVKYDGDEYDLDCLFCDLADVIEDGEREG